MTGLKTSKTSNAQLEPNLAFSLCFQYVKKAFPFNSVHECNVLVNPLPAFLSIFMFYHSKVTKVEF